MKLRYTITQESYFDFNIYHFENATATRKQARKTRVLPPVIWSLTSFVFCGYFYLTQQTVPIAMPGALLVVSALWYAFYPYCFRRSLEKKIRRWLAQGVGKECIGDFTLELREDCIRISDESGVTETKYSDILQLAENKNCLYIYIAAASAHIIPFAAFGGEDDVRECKRLIEDKMGAAAHTQETVGE